MTDGAVFYMDPKKAPKARQIVVGQLTTATRVQGKRVVANFSGKQSGNGKKVDYHQHGVVFKLD